MLGSWRSGLMLVPLVWLWCDAATAAPEDGLTPEQQQLRTAWATYCDQLKASGERLLTLDTGRPLDTAEGFQYLAMLSASAIDRIQYYEAPERPIAARMLDGYRKFGLDSSDNSYRVVHFDPAGSYRIRGVRGSSTYLGFQFNRGEAAVANLNHAQLDIADDGSFELYFGGQHREKDWIELPPDADNLYVREIFIDWAHETPSPLWIERLDRIEPAPPVDAATMSARLVRAAASVDASLLKWNGYVSRMRTGRRNELPVPRGTASEGGSPDNLYSGGYFALAPDEVLLVETDPVPARFWNVQLGNAWFQSLDYQYRQTSLNSAQALPDADGVIRVVVAHEDPGIANWLDTAGHAEGIVFYRWNGARAAPGRPRVQVLKRSDLESALPEGVVRVEPAQRTRILAERYAGVARRFGL